MDLTVLRTSLNLDAKSLVTVADRRGQYTALLTTETKHVQAVVFKAVKPSVYNQYDSDGLQMSCSDSDNIQVFIDCGDDKDTFHILLQQVTGISEGRYDGIVVCNWTWENWQRHAQGLPFQPNVERRVQKQPVAGRAEFQLKKRMDEWFVQGELPYPITRWNRQNPEADPVQCSRYRPDFIYEIEKEQRVVIVEHDEGAHASYELPCELKRQLELGLGFGGRPIHFLRYNPSPGLQHEPLIARREALLLKRLQAALAPAPADDSLFNFFLTVEYLYYPPIGGGRGALQTFRFRTYAEYVQWANAIDDGSTPPVRPEDPPAAEVADAEEMDTAADEQPESPMSYCESERDTASRCPSPAGTSMQQWSDSATPSFSPSVSVEPTPSGAAGTLSVFDAELRELALERARINNARARHEAVRARLIAKLARSDAECALLDADSARLDARRGALKAHLLAAVDAA